jgi:hypothetical protein
MRCGPQRHSSAACAMRCAAAADRILAATGLSRHDITRWEKEET